MVIALSSIPAIAHTATALHRHRPSPPPPFPPAPSAVPRCARGCTARSRAAWRRSTREEGGAPVRALTPPPQRTPRSASASPEPQPQPNPSPNPNLLPCVKTLVTLRCKLKRGPGLALGPLGAPEYESRLNSRSRVPLPTFYCIFYPFRWQSPAEVHWTVHVDCPRAQIQTFWVLSAQRPLQAPLSCPGVPRGYHHLNR